MVDFLDDVGVLDDSGGFEGDTLLLFQGVEGDRDLRGLLEEGVTQQLLGTGSLLRVEPAHLLNERQGLLGSLRTYLLPVAPLVLGEGVACQTRQTVPFTPGLLAGGAQYLTYLVQLVYFGGTGE